MNTYHPDSVFLNWIADRLSNFHNQGETDYVQRLRRMAEAFAKPPNLTPAHIERLAILAEECSEVVQAVCKTLRHGYDSKHPQRDEMKDPDNRKMIEDELKDVKFAVGIMEKNGDINVVDYKTQTAIRDLEKRKSKYWHHQPKD